jgi:tetratricopeptide (TPR) repeat protein
VPTAITAHKVLLELPDDLVDERRAFGAAVHSFNETDAVPRGVLFVPLGWEPGVALARQEISEELQQIDYFVLVFGDRWRAGAEEEFELAMECLRNGGHPMSRIVVFFKPVPPRQLSDPGEQLRRVLALKQRLEAEREVTLEALDSVEAFQRRVRWHLARWLIEHERPPQPVGGSVERDPAVGDTEAGQRWRSHPLSDDPDSYNEYGLFLQRDGMAEAAVEVFEQALALARDKNRPIDMAIAYGNLGVIHERRHEHAEAEEMFQKALEICESHGRRIGAAACHHGLGTVYRSQDRLDEAEQMFRKALECEQALDRRDGMAACYASLAVIHDYQRNRDQANEMRRLARTVGEESEYPRGGLFPSKI